MKLSLLFLCSALFAAEPSLLPKPINALDIQQKWQGALRDVEEGTKLFESLGKPIVTVFGGHFARPTDLSYQKAYEISRRLVEAGCAIVTGGGEGIMEAANCGAIAAGRPGITSIAIGVKGLGKPNECAQSRLMVDTFFPRKWLLMDYSSGFVLFPGGEGSLDELATLLTLIVTKQMPPVPIYAFDKNYWKLISEWLKYAVKKGLLVKEALQIVTFTDNLEEIERGIMESIKNER